MGLDMYLNKTYYVKNWSYMKPEEKHTITILKGDKPSSIPTDKIKRIDCEVMYWRKANAIHKWFVDNVQGGKDDCDTYDVSIEQLKELLVLCTEVLEKSKIGKGANYAGETWKSGEHTINYVDGKVITNPQVAESLLPTAGGFFFGCTDYDEGYLQDIEYTKTELEKLLANDDGGDYEYHSSW